jgi:hypothetical protein
VDETERPKPGFEGGRGLAGSTSDAATETGVNDEHAPRPARATDRAMDVGGLPDAGRQTVPADVPDTWNANRIDVGPESMRGEERGPAPTAADPFADVEHEDVEADRTSYRRRSGI